LTQRLPDLDPRFADVVSRAMARDPNDRFATANEMIQALDALGYGGFTGSAALEPMPAEPQRSTVSAVTGQRTQGTFASSQQTGTGAAKSPSRLILVAGAVVLLLAGGAFAAYRVLGGKSAEPIAAGSVTAEPELKPKAAAEVPTAPAATAAPAPSVAPSVALATPASATASAAASASAAVAVRDVPKRVPGPLPRPAAGAAKPAGTTKASSKSSRDFGY
jgi:hypothetical protein